MSVDLSDPAFTSARQAVLDPKDPSQWLLLRYVNPSSPGPISLLSSGPGPVVPALRQALEEAQSENEVLFGYGEVGGKGMVLVFLKDSVGGVRRARAIVHSRAVASQFPEYTALITIAHPSQLTDDIVGDKLDLGNNHPSSSATPHPHPAPSAAPRTSLATTPHLPASSLGPTQPLPSSPDPHPLPDPPASTNAPFPLGKVIPPTRTSVEEHPEPTPHELSTSTPADSLPSLPTASRQASSAYHDSNSSSRHPSSSAFPAPPGFVSHSPPDQTEHAPSPRSQLPPLPAPSMSPERPLEHRGISSADLFPEQRQRDRKASLTARLGKSFGAPLHNSGGSGSPGRSTSASSQPHSPSQSRTPSGLARLGKSFGAPNQSPQHSPNGVSQSPEAAQSSATAAPLTPPSPSSGRFKPSNLVRAFNRRRSDQSTPPVSPRVDQDFDAPPTPPPKDGFGFIPPKNRAMYTYTPAEIAQAHAQSQGMAGLGMGMGMGMRIPEEGEASRSGGGSISPSPSAREVLASARQKSIDEEAMVQRRFRLANSRHNSAQNGNRNATILDSEEEEDDVRLAYDDPGSDDDEDRGAREIAGRRVEDGMSDGERGEAVRQMHEGDRAEEEAQKVRELMLGAEAGERQRQAEEQTRQEAEEAHQREEQDRRVQAEREAGERQRLAEEQAEEDRRIEEERQREAAEAEAERQRRAMERLKLEEAEAERRRLEQSEAERRSLEAEEAERQRLAEEERIRQEAAAAEAERRRVEEEERARAEEARIRVEEERIRVEEERRRVEEERVRAEEARVREEEETRVRKVEEEKRVRKDSIREGLLRGKREGGVMLSGWVTVQTTRSTIWRRRWFALWPGEMRLFKAEKDAKPIQVIHLAPGSKLSQAYEESQVQGSFHIASRDPSGQQEDFFLFTDSAEDKETVLEGLQMAMS